MNQVFVRGCEAEYIGGLAEGILSSCPFVKEPTAESEEQTEATGGSGKVDLDLRPDLAVHGEVVKNAGPLVIHFRSGDIFGSRGARSPQYGQVSMSAETTVCLTQAVACKLVGNTQDHKRTAVFLPNAAEHGLCVLGANFVGETEVLAVHSLQRLES